MSQRHLRRNQTPAERALWQHLRRKQLGGLRFRRQHPIGRFVVDFYCPARRLVIEVDGESHAYQAEYDVSRTAWLEMQGYHILRFTNADVRENINAVLAAIREFAE